MRSSSITHFTSASTAVLLAAWLAVLTSCGGGSGGGGPSPVAATIGINTSAGWSDSPFISRDGQRLYFAYSRYNFAPYLQSIANGVSPPVAPRATGPTRPGLHQSATNAFDETDIYVATKKSDGIWSEPSALGFNGAFGDASGKEVTDAAGTVAGFVWLQSNGSTSDIVFAIRNSDGTWGTPTPISTGVNLAPATQDNPMMVRTATGDALWFTSNRAGGVGCSDIWFAVRANGVWEAPVNIGSPVNGAGNEDQFWVSQANADVYWNGPAGLMHCISNGNTCPATGPGAPAPVVLAGCGYAAQASVTDDGREMYVACGDLTTFFVKVMHAVKQSDGSWGPAIAVD